MLIMEISKIASNVAAYHFVCYTGIYWNGNVAQGTIKLEPLHVNFISK